MAFKDDTARDAAIADLKEGGYIVRTQDEESSFLDSHTQQKINNLTSRHATEIESTVRELTGIEQNTDEKYFDYMKRGIGVVKTNGETALNDLQSKYDTLDNEFKKKSPEYDTIKQQFDTFKTTKNKEVTDLQTQLEELQNETSFAGIKNNIMEGYNSVLGSLKNDPLVLEVARSRLNGFIASQKDAKHVNGVYIFQKEDGSPRIATTDGHHLSSKEIMADMMKDLVDESRAKGGAGSGQGDGGGEGNAGVTDFPEGVENKVQLYEHIKNELKLNEDSKEFHEKMNEYLKLYQETNKKPLKVR